MIERHAELYAPAQVGVRRSRARRILRDAAGVVDMVFQRGLDPLEMASSTGQVPGRHRGGDLVKRCFGLRRCNWRGGALPGLRVLGHRHAQRRSCPQQAETQGRSAGPLRWTAYPAGSRKPGPGLRESKTREALETTPRTVRSAGTGRIKGRKLEERPAKRHFMDGN